jgi:D-serine deaminase-like pyridoxal phosphate-dependent protein
LATGSIGICTAKVSEAEAMLEHGVEKVMMTSNPTASKIRRAMRIRKFNPSFTQAVDEEQNARDLSAAAKEAGVVADVVIDVAVGTRSGIPPGEGAVELAKVVDNLPYLKLRGMLWYDGGAQHVKGFAARKERALKGEGCTNPTLTSGSSDMSTATVSVLFPSGFTRGYPRAVWR